MSSVVQTHVESETVGVTLAGTRLEGARLRTSPAIPPPCYSYAPARRRVDPLEGGICRYPAREISSRVRAEPTPAVKLNQLLTGAPSQQTNLQTLGKMLLFNSLEHHARVNNVREEHQDHHHVTAATSPKPQT